jgi:2-polyprenyl-3-methyl-5-hydroxy-6-metoxy-1,4-benzoquinol methylase
VNPDLDKICPACGTQSASAPCGIPYRGGEFVHCELCDHYWITGASASASGADSIQVEHFGAEFANREDFFQKLYQGMNARRALRACMPEQGAKVLEVGPGAGYLMDVLARRGCSVIGLDLSQAVVDTIRRRFTLTVLRESLASCADRVGDEQFELVVMCHVIEHFSRPLEELTQVYRLLKTGARVYVAVPNMGSWHARFRGWNGYEAYHFHYFTATSLRRLFERAGFDIEHESSWEGLTAWTNTIYRGWAGARAPASAAAGNMERRHAGRQVLEIVRLGVGIVTTPIRWMQAALGAGEELILVARKA